MKRWIALVLVAVMGLSLCACSGKYDKYQYINEMLDNGDYEGAVMAIYELYQQENGDSGENNGENGDSNDDPEDNAEPSDEEWNLLNEYCGLVARLNQYSEDNSNFYYYDDAEGIEYYGSVALAKTYARLSEMEGVDKWANSQYVQNQYSWYEGSWDRQEVLNRFTSVQDVSLRQTRTYVDNMGNESTNTQQSWKYDENGNLTYANPYVYHDLSHFSTYYRYEDEYDSDGKLTKRSYYSGDTLERIVTYSYDSNGYITNEHHVTNSSEVDYVFTCDAQGRVKTISWGTIIIGYTYNAAGNVTEILKTEYSSNGDVLYIKEMKYLYNPEGVLKSGTYTSSNYVFSYHHQRVDTYEYTCDARGRVISEVIHCGDDLYTTGDKAGEICSRADYETVRIDTEYGDYYFYH